MRTSSLAALATLILAGCGSPPAAKNAGPEASAAAEPAPTASGSAAPEDAPPAASDASPGSDAKPEGDAKPPGDDAAPKGRDVTYRMTATGIVIEVEGVKLEPKAEPFQKGGGWGVRLTVKATAIDDHMHRLLTPEVGPLMVAAEIDHGGGKKEHVSDERKGDGEQFLTAGDSTKLEREFAHPIRSGESLTLFVGLWGLGRDAEDRRPVRKLFQVRMVAGSKKPQPVITAPE